MASVLRSLLLTLRTLAYSRAALHFEMLALRHQLNVLQRTRPHRVRLAKTDRWFWVVIAGVWAGCVLRKGPDSFGAGEGRADFRGLWVPVSDFDNTMHGSSQ